MKRVSTRISEKDERRYVQFSEMMARSLAANNRNKAGTFSQSNDNDEQTMEGGGTQKLTMVRTGKSG